MKMERKMMRRVVREDDDEMGEIKKGPWKAEEDQVLINHVKKYGPRDWSSIRNKGLLRRTGKSCRLRWVNKLRPDLKTGVKFSAEEERTVIDLQAQFGNKWARIATYLPGRTDNDVKNFWSSRQKRLARILQSSAAPSSNKSHKNKISQEVQVEVQVQVQVQAPAYHDVPSVEAPKFSSSTDQEESVVKSQSCSSSYLDDTEAIKMVPFGYEHSPFQLNCCTAQLQPDFFLPPDSQDFIARLSTPSFFLDEFEHSRGSALGTGQLPVEPSIFAPDRTYQVPGMADGHYNAVDLDSFIYDFPPLEDIFDDIKPLNSPPDWS